MENQSVSDVAIITPEGLDALIVVLAAANYRVLGPTLRDGAIIYDDIAGVADLPEGVTDRQEAGRYRLEQRDDDALFGYTVGPQSWKKFLHPARQTLWRARRDGDGMTIDVPVEEPPRFAFIGVRACEISAIAIQDRVFLEGPYRDAGYDLRRKDAFIVALNCAEAGGTCFCTSMGTGPKAQSGFDLALTELIGDGRHEFLVEIGTERGLEILRQVPNRPGTDADRFEAQQIVDYTAAHMGRELETTGLKELLQGQLTSAQWDKVAERCLTCGNCTMVCPTCFCTTVEDHTDLAGVSAERVREWDSCFTMDFSYIHGGSVRTSTSSRYRQWMTHKLAGWVDQFGTSGCVGCGRCVTWCPVGIDITAEAAAIRAASQPTPEPSVAHA